MKRSRRVATTLYMLDGGPEGHLWRSSPVPPGCRTLPHAEPRPILALKRERSAEDLAIHRRAFCAIDGSSEEGASRGSGQSVSPQWSFFAGGTSPSERLERLHLASACSSASTSFDSATTSETSGERQSTASDASAPRARLRPKPDSARTTRDSSDSGSDATATSSREPSDSEREMFGDISESQGDVDSDPPSDRDADGETDCPDDSGLSSTHESPDLLIGRSPLAPCGLMRPAVGERMIGPPPGRRRQRRRRRARTLKIATPANPSEPSAMDEKEVKDEATTEAAVPACFGHAAAGKAGEFHREWRVMSGANYQTTAPSSQPLFLGKRGYGFHDRPGRGGYQGQGFNGPSDGSRWPTFAVHPLPVQALPAHAAPSHAPVSYAPVSHAPVDGTVAMAMTEDGGGGFPEDGVHDEGDEALQLLGGAMLIVG